MANIDVQVDLYTSGNNNSQTRADKHGFLDIGNRALHHIEFEPNVDPAFPDVSWGPHKIQFFLQMADLIFCDLDDDRNPGFTWIGQSPGTIMRAERSPEGKMIIIHNDHKKSRPHTDHTSGHWHYQLFAKNNSSGDIYGIPWTSCNGPNDSNPSIKNR